MQIQTEKGAIWVEAEYQTSEEATQNGYTYAFRSERLKKDVYRKVETSWHHHPFALCAI